MRACSLHGVTIHHRRSFGPIRNLLQGYDPAVEEPLALLAGE